MLWIFVINHHAKAILTKIHNMCFLEYLRPEDHVILIAPLGVQVVRRICYSVESVSMTSVLLIMNQTSVM